MFLFALASIALLAGEFTTYAFAKPRTAVRTIVQFPNGTWLENIAVRSNGHLLVTLLGVPEIWTVDPTTSTKGLVARLPGMNGIFGLDELAPDVFAVAAGNFTLASATTLPGSYSVWRLDAKTNVTTKVVDVPTASILNGLTTLDAAKGDVLASDSTLGTVLKINAYTGANKVVIADAAFAPPEDGLQLGVNGIRLTKDKKTLYFNNFGRSIFGRIPLAADGTPSGPTVILAHDIGQVDDFALSACGSFAYDAVNPQNQLLKIALKDGETTVIAGALDSALIPGATAVAIGRTARDKDIAYVVTGGGQAAPVNGTYVEGGKVVAVSGRW